MITRVLRVKRKKKFCLDIIAGWPGNRDAADSLLFLFFLRITKESAELLAKELFDFNYSNWSIISPDILWE